jgi:PPOX class probable F420-dependent enzyme
MTGLPADVRILFENANQAHVATLLPDGAPHSVPVWVGVEGDRVAFLTSPNSRKARNLERDPRVCVSVTDADRPFTMAGVRGRVTERLEGDAAWQIIDRISRKYTGGPYPVREDRVVFLIEPEPTRGLGRSDDHVRPRTYDPSATPGVGAMDGRRPR